MQTSYNEKGESSNIGKTFQSLADSDEFNEINEKLNTGKEYIEMVFDKARYGIAIMVNMNFKYVNPRFLNIFGYDSFSELQKMNLIDLIEPKSIPIIVERIKKAKTGKSNTFNFNIKGVKNDGILIDLDIRSTPMHNSKMACVLCIEDITENKRNEDELLTLRTAVDQSPSIVMITNKNGNIEYVNPVFTKISGYSFNEVIGKNPRFLKTESSLPALYKNLWNSITTGGEWRGILKNKKKDGSYFWISTFVSVVKNKNNEITHFFAVQEDITHHKKTEENLQLSEERFFTLFESSPVAIAVTQNLKFKFINPSLVKLFAYKNRNELLQINPLELLIPSEIEKGREYNRKREKGDDVPYNYESIGIKKNGDHFPIRISATRIELEVGYATIAFVEDISMQKQHEEMQKQILNDLKLSNKEMKEFGSIISHDLRSPMLGIALLSDLIVREYHDVLDEGGRERLNQVNMQVKKMDVLLKEVYNYSMSGISKANRDQFYSKQVINNLIKTFVLSTNTNITLVGEFPSITYNMTQFVQVLSNLLNNAIIHNEKENGEIKIYTSKKIDHWIFHIQDNGVGIDEKYYKQIFKMFKSLNPTNDPKSTGVGLAIVKKIVEENGGSISVKSKLGKGSTFSFTVPK